MFGGSAVLVQQSQRVDRQPSLPSLLGPHAEGSRVTAEGKAGPRVQGEQGNCMKGARGSLGVFPTSATSNLTSVRQFCLCGRLAVATAFGPVHFGSLGGRLCGWWHGRGFRCPHPEGHENTNAAVQKTLSLWELRICGGDGRVEAPRQIEYRQERLPTSKGSAVEQKKPAADEHTNALALLPQGWLRRESGKFFSGVGAKLQVHYRIDLGPFLPKIVNKNILIP